MLFLFYMIDDLISRPVQYNKLEIGHADGVTARQGCESNYLGWHRQLSSSSFSSFTIFSISQYKNAVLFSSLFALIKGAFLNCSNLFCKENW